MSTDLLALLEKDPAAGILAVADLREGRATTVNEGGPGIWYVAYGTISGPGYRLADVREPYKNNLLTQHMAAEANPAHALTVVRRWRGVVERHQAFVTVLGTVVCAQCRPENLSIEDAPQGRHPCPEIRETTDEARAYLYGAQ